MLLPAHDDGGKSRRYFHHYYYYYYWVCIYLCILKTDVRKRTRVRLVRRCDNAAYVYGKNPVRFSNPLRVICVINRTPRSLVRLVLVRTAYVPYYRIYLHDR